MVDSYLASVKDEVDRVIRSIGLCKLQESVYESCRSDRNIEELKQDLEGVGVSVDPEFQKWAEDEVEEMSSVNILKSDSFLKTSFMA